MWISMFRTVILYGLILVAVRLMGKRQISQLQTSELVVTLLLSELAVLPIQNYDEPLINGIAPMAVLVTFEILIATLMIKSDWFRCLICGKPVVVIKKGVVQQKAMRKLRMATEDLFEQLRQNNAFKIEEVEYAIIETNGMMSVIKKPEADSMTPKQAGVKVAPFNIETVVVSDGVLAKNSIKLIEKNRKLGAGQDTGKAP